MRRGAAMPQDPAAAEAGTIRQDAAAADAVGPEETGTLTPNESPATDSGKAAMDLAKRSAGHLFNPTDPAAEGQSANAALVPAFLVAGTRPVPPLVYPDPRASPATAEPIDPAAAEAAEEALSLSRGDRREIQRRLRFASSDPQMIDGIFGPATRSAIAAWQAQAGLPATGFLDETAVALLVEQTADQYRAWRVAERTRAREREAQSEIVASSAPPPSRSQHDGCRRTASGEIAFGRDVGCNLRAFGDNFRRDVRDLKGSIRQLFD
jgi:peptidoglycan hydrolase-like protein with peptidoglycan-binding domain